jgi:hypothetical protein
MRKMKLNPEWVNARYEEHIVNQRTFKMKEPIRSESLRKQCQTRMMADAVAESIMKYRGLEQLATGPRRWNTLEAYAAGEPPIPKYVLV